MFLHHTMTNEDVLRSCQGCESRQLRLVADRLREQLELLAEINKLARRMLGNAGTKELVDLGTEIHQLSKPQ